MLGEFDIIRRYFSVDLDAHDVVVGIGDDAAVVRVGPGELAVAVDALVEGVHFPVGTPARAIGHRALAVNLSDMAATGAEPRWATLALTLPHAEPTWLADFAAGFFECARRHKVLLVGGDTVRGPLQVAVQVMGSVAPGGALRRAGGAAGDDIYLSGTVGDAAAGLRKIGRHECSEYLRQRFLYPEPRVELGLALRGWASAAIDVSDGLTQDLGHLAAASGCGAHVDLDRLPLSAELCADFEPAERHYLALNGGDDYELCFTVPAARRRDFDNWCTTRSERVTRVGALVDGAAVVWRRAGEVVSMPGGGYDHFGGLD